MWYVIQTTTGKEQELVDVIHKSLPSDIYNECFFMKRELLKRLGGKWLEVTETLFPAYVFLDMDEPEKMFYHLKKVPELTKILGDNSGEFIPLEEEEVNYLEMLCRDAEENNVGKRVAQSGFPSGSYSNRKQMYQPLVKISKVYMNRTGEVIYLKGPLTHFKEKIVKLNLRKRYAIIEFILRGEIQTALLGIKLETDMVE